MTVVPETHYIKNGNVYIAYQVVGEGPQDLIFVPGWVSNIEIIWEDPRQAQFLNHLASFTRLILFDKRGTGLSDRVANIPDLETRMDDVRAVMDAVGSEQAALCGHSEGGSMCCLFSATYPERVTAQIIMGGFAKRVRGDDYPIGLTPEEFQQVIDHTERGWGGPVRIETLAPSLSKDPLFRDYFARYLRLSASPSAAAEVNRVNAEIDIRHVLPTIHVPTLLLHTAGDKAVPMDASRYMAEHIPNAKLVELEGTDHMFGGSHMEQMTAEISEFLTGVRPGREPERVLATVLFTDIVDSTAKASALGDSRWRRLLEQHHTTVRRELAAHRGREIDNSGDGFLAAFDGPARAVRCARSIGAALQPLGVTIRAGLHTGECELMGDRIGGIAVHIGARVAALAESDEILVSSTVKDLVAGSGIEFEALGPKTLKGVPDQWQVFRVTSC